MWQRLGRGYGPLAALVVLLLLMSVFVPSKASKATKASTTGTNGNGYSSTGGGTGNGATGDGTGPCTSATTGAPAGSASSSSSSSSTSTTAPCNPAAGESGGGAGGTGTAQNGAQGGGQANVPTSASVCPDRKLQVPNDPYSPACLAFSGNNGGATTQGVTPTEIHVAYRMTSDKGFQQTLASLGGAALQDSPDDVKRTVQTLAQYFNQHFQFYGRKLVIDFYNGQGQLTNELLGQGQAQATADATTVATQMKSFADLSAQSQPYADALARRKVMGFGDPYMSRQWHIDHAPYIWSIATDGTKVASFGAEYYVKRLAGRPAEFAGGDLKGKPRKLGTLAPENSYYQESVQVARGVVQKAGVDPGNNYEYQLDLSTMSNQAANLIPKMKSDGITTILCGCDPIIPVFLSGVAARSNYYPEFVIVGTALTDTDIVGQLWDQGFTSHAFGISPLEQETSSTSSIGYKAYKSVRNDEPAFTVDLIYAQMYEMAIGIEMAGPDLTPKNFEAGMFHYGPHLGPMGLWNFGPGNYTTGDDVREVYWCPNAVSAYNSKRGAYVDPNPGKRYTAGNLPTGEPVFPNRTSAACGAS